MLLYIQSIFKPKLEKNSFFSFDYDTCYAYFHLLCAINTTCAINAYDVMIPILFIWI